MSKISITPYCSEHLEQLELREHERTVMRKDHLNMGLLSLNTFAVTAIDESGKPIAIYAYSVLAPGLLEIMVIPSKFMAGHGISIVRTLRRYQKQLEAVEPDYRRMQTRSLADEATDRWMRILGFTEEGIHPKYAPDGSTYKSWGRVASG